MSETTAKQTGRPSLRTPELVEELIDWLASGKVLTEFCQQPRKPAWRTIYDWMDADPELSAAIARAREVGYDVIAEDALRIADTPREGIETTTSDKDGTKEVRADMLGHRKLQVETRLKLLAKWSPKKYGDRIHQEVTGKDGGPVQYEDTRDRNLHAIEQISARLAGPAAGETASGPAPAVDSGDVAG